MSNTKANDWVAVLLNNPDFGFLNFKDVGLTADNTGLLDKDKYKNSQYVQEHFKDSEGKFDETAFNKFYDSAASSYLTFANDLFEDDVFNDVKYDPYDALRPRESEIEQPKFGIIRVQNPNKLKTGISRVGRTDEREWSISELAQRERVYDWKAKQWKDYTPNDNVLFGNLGGFMKSLTEPLVIAQWDSEGTHVDPTTGRTVKHKKGDYKYNEEGNYYYETLGGREAYGKQFKSLFDSFTVDGTKANKYDFFDSDGLDKSVTGTLMKTVTTIAPLFVPGLSAYYGAALVGTSLLDILPTVYKSTLGLVGKDNNTPYANYMQGVGRTFKGSKTEYSQNNLLSTENFFDLITDVALQWAQLRAIFSGYHKLKGTSKLQAQASKEAAEMGSMKAVLDEMKGVRAATDAAIKQNVEMAGVMLFNKLQPLLEARNRTAANAALGYMALLSGADAYESAIALGADRLEAAVVAWGTIGGLYGIMRTGLGEVFFPELKKEGTMAAQKAIDSVGKEVGKSFSSIAANTVNESKKKGLAKLFNASKEKSSELWKGLRNHSLTFTQKALGEGIEEVSEELVSDLVKQTFNWASEFGITRTGKKLDAWKDMTERYGMAFFGGAIGGAVFAGVDYAQNRKNPEALNQELIYLIRNNKTSELLEELDKMRKSGKLGNKYLSATKYELDSNDPSKVLWASPTNAEDNQNEATYRLVKNYINSLNSVIHQEGLAYSDGELLDKMVMGDERMKALINFGKNDGEAFGPLVANGYHGLMLQDWNTLVSDIIKIDGELRELDNEYADSNQGGTKNKNSIEYQTKLQEILTRKQEKLTERDKFLTGQYSRYYTDLMLFAIDNNVNHFFLPTTFKDWAELTTGKSLNNLSKAQIDELKPLYESYKSKEAKEHLKGAYEVFKDFNKKGSLQVGELGEIYEQFKLLRDLVQTELVDKEATDEMLLSTKSNDIEIVEGIFKNKLGKTLSFKPIINPAYLLIQFVPNAEASVEENLANKNEIDLHNQQALANISNLISNIKSIGYIDMQTRDMLLQALNNPTAKSLILTEKAKVTLPNFSANAKLLEEFDNLIDNITLNNIEDSKLKLEELLKSDDIIEIAKLYAQENEDLYFAGMIAELETEDQILQKFSNAYNDLMQRIEATLNSDVVMQLVNRLSNELLTIKENPVFNLLKQFSNNAYGENINIFNILELEDLRFKSVQSISEYVLDSNRALEIDHALKVVDMTEAIINASSTLELTAGLPFGHNQTMNYFLLKYFPKEELLGEVKEDLAFAMKEDLNSVRKLLLFLKELSNINAVNQFAEHKKTGRVVTKLLTDIIKGKNEYAFLKDINYNGQKLFEGIEDIATSSLDSDSIEDSIFIEADRLFDHIHNNFNKIVKDSGKPAEEVFKEMFSDLKSKFSETSLLELKNTLFTSLTKYIEDFDVFMWLTSLIAMKRSDFNYYLREVLNQEDIKFAPLYSQEYAAEIGVSYLVNPEIFNTAIDLISSEPGQEGEELVKLKNLLMVNGIGGAGKTSVVALLINRISLLVFPDSEIFKAGPTDEQAKNLTLSLGAGTEHTIDSLMRYVLGDEDFAKLLNDIKNNAETSNYYNIIKYKAANGQEVKVARLNDDIELNSNDAPKIVFLDETTHINSIYLLYLSKWAKQNNVLILSMGDLFQNGFDNPDLGMFNITPDTVLTIRTPKLGISLRVTNIQKKDNTNSTIKLLETLDIGEVIKEAMADPSQYDAILKQKASEFKDFILKTLILKYYLDDENPLNGEKIIKSLNQETLLSLLKNNTEVGYVYDNEDSETYKMITDFIKNNPDVSKRIKLYTPKSVQGSEKPYFIIDIDFAKYKFEESPMESFKFLKNFYTMISRSKEGTILIDRGLSNIIPESNVVQDLNTSKTQDPTNIIKDFRLNKLEILDKSLEGYTPSDLTRKEETEEDNETSEEPESTPEPTPAPTPSPVTSTPEPTASPAPEPKPESKVEPKIESKPEPEESLPPIASKSTEKLETAKDEDPIPDEDFDEEFLEALDNPKFDSDNTEMKGIRVYGWYMRYGVEEFTEQDGSTTLTKFRRKARKEGVIDDLNVFLSKNKEYTEALIKTPKRMLNTVREYLTLGQDFDEHFLDLLKERGFGGMANLGASPEETLEILNSGSYKLQVRKNDEAIDKARDKNGYDASKVEPVAFNIVYQINTPKFGILEFTLGKLTKPETWKTWLDSNGKNKKVLDSYNNYARWYEEKSLLVLRDDTEFNYDIPRENITFAGSTRLKAVPDGEAIKKFDLDKFNEDNPGAIRSSLYIYSGSKGILDKKDGTRGGVSDKVRGKGVIFVTAYQDLVIDGEPVTPDNIASMYMKLNLDRNNSNPLIRMVVVEPKGVFISSSNSERGFFDLSFDDLRDADGKINKADIKKMFSTYGSNTTAAKMIMSLWNYRMGLARLEDLIDKHSDLSEKLINNIMELNSELAGNEFRLVPEDVRYYGLSVDPATKKTVITKKQLKAQKAFLDSLLDLFTKVVTLPKGTEKAKYAMTTNSNSARAYADYKNLIDSLTANNAELIFDDGKNQFRHPAFSKNGSFKVISIMSAIYRLYNNKDKKWDYNSFRVHTKDVDQLDIELDLSNIAMVISSALKNNGVDTAPGTFLKNTFNMIFHGRVNPYKEEIKVPRPFAPFPNGIYYHARYERTGLPVSDFYPASNSDSQFTYNVAVERGNFEINIDPTKLHESKPELEDLFKMKEAVNQSLGNFATQLQNIGLDNVTIQNLISEFNTKYENSGDAVLTEIYKNLATSTNKILKDFVNNGKLFNDMNLIISAKISINKSGVIKMDAKYLTDVINEINSALLPKDAEGNVDMNQIVNIEYNGSLYENFVVTLANGNTIEGKRVKTKTKNKIELKTTTLYLFALTEDASLLFKEITDPKAIDLTDSNAENISKVIELLNIISSYHQQNIDEAALNILGESTDAAINIIIDNLSEYDDFTALLDPLYDIQLAILMKSNLICKI